MERMTQGESNKKISEIGMRKALAYEREHNRNPSDVSHRHGLGYDIISSDRKIEVKGQKGVWKKLKSDSIQFTLNELNNATHLYIVCDVFGSPDLHIFEVSKIPFNAVTLKFVLHMARCRDYEVKE